jgi:hypothetical protein
MKQFEHTLKTYAYSHCNMYNIPIYFYNIDIKHLQRTSETYKTLETYAFNAMLLCCLGEWRLVVVEVGGEAEITGTVAARASHQRGGVTRSSSPHLLPRWSSGTVTVSGQRSGGGRRGGARCGKVKGLDG